MDMKLYHESTKKYEVYEVTVNIDGEKTYVFYLSSAYAYARFLSFYRKGYHGKALNVLKKFNEKKES